VDVNIAVNKYFGGVPIEYRLSLVNPGRAAITINDVLIDHLRRLKACKALPWSFNQADFSFRKIPGFESRPFHDGFRLSPPFFSRRNENKFYLKRETAECIVAGSRFYNDRIVRTSSMIGLIMTNTVGTEGRGLKGGIRSIATMCCRNSRLFIQMVKWIARGLQRTGPFG